MKYLLLLVLLCAGCAHTSTVTNKPDVAPVKNSNAQTRQHIKATQAHIEASMKSSDEGEGSLKSADKLLERLENE